jgi:hypothetical protein
MTYILLKIQRILPLGTDVMILKNISAEKFGDKFGVFDLKQS